jgi:hypothetical protein
VGCTCEPEITYVRLQPGVDCFLVLATDGVWDVLTNEQVSQAPNPAAVGVSCKAVWMCFRESVRLTGQLSAWVCASNHSSLLLCPAYPQVLPFNALHAGV